MAGPGQSDPRIAAVLDRLGQSGLHVLRAFPPDGTPIPMLSADMEQAVQDLLGLELLDPESLVSFRVHLVEPCAGGLRLSRLGRAAASAAVHAD